MRSGCQSAPKGSVRGKKWDRDGNPTDLAGFYKHAPSFIWGPMLLAGTVAAANHLCKPLKERLADGRAVRCRGTVSPTRACLLTMKAIACARGRSLALSRDHAILCAPLQVYYGLEDTCTYTVFAILMTFAAHGWFCVHVAQERQLQTYEKHTRDADGNRLQKPAEGQAAMSYSDRMAPRGASVRSTAALLTSWVYAFFPFGAPSSSWAVFIGWTCALAVYWDAHFYVAHRLAHVYPTLYKFFHKKHHYYTAPDVFGAYYVTYQSHVMTEQLVVLLAAYAGLPRDVFTWTIFMGTLDTCVKHSGHSIGSVQRGMPCSYETLMTILNPWSLVLGGAGAAEHDWHHEKFFKNYALSYNYLDRLFGSYHPGRVAGEEVGLSRQHKLQREEKAKMEEEKAKMEEEKAKMEEHKMKVEKTPATADGLMGQQVSS